MGPHTYYHTHYDSRSNHDGKRDHQNRGALPVTKPPLRVSLVIEWLSPLFVFVVLVFILIHRPWPYWLKVCLTRTETLFCKSHPCPPRVAGFTPEATWSTFPPFRGWPLGVVEL